MRYLQIPTSKFIKPAALSTLALFILSTSGVTANADSQGQPAPQAAEPAQYQAMLRDATLLVDDFSQDPSDSWSIHTAGSSVNPSLAFQATGSGIFMNVNWTGEPVGVTVSVTRQVSKQDWSGYNQLQFAITNASLREDPWVSLSNDNGQLYKVPLEGQGVSVTPNANGWSTVTVSLKPLVPAHPAHTASSLNGLPPLGSITHLTFGTDIASNTATGHLDIGDIQLSDSKGFDGPSAYLDTSFYNGQNWTDIAQKVHSQGFTAVHLIALNLDGDQTHALAAFHAYDIPVALSIFPTTNLAAYNAHPDWRQLSLGGLSNFDWRVYLSPSNPDFVSWLDGKISEEFHKYSYDGFEMTEPWLEVWGGPYKDNPSRKYYMDISQNAVNAFEKQYGYNPVDALFLKDSNGSYYLNPNMVNSPQYQQWQTFRVNTIDSFLASLVDSAKHARNGITTFVTYLADVRVDGGQSYNKVREYQAQDLEDIQQTVKPDVIILQSPWQDWGQADLPANYIKDYANAYLPRIRPDIKVIVQTDVGSTVKRGFDWLKQFSATAETSGFDGYQIYEWSVAGWNIKPTSLLLGDFTGGTIDGWLPYGSDMTCNVTFPTDPSLGHPVAYVQMGSQSSVAWAVFERYGLVTKDWSTQGVNGIDMQFKGDGSSQSVKFVVQDNGGQQWVAYIPLGDTSWHAVHLPFSSFQPYASGASGPIDANAVDNIERVKFVVEGTPLSPAFSFSVYDIHGVN